MGKPKYKSIRFGKDILKMTYADFKVVFEPHHDFRGLQPKQREIELKKAYKIAINGNTTGATKQSEKANSKKS